MFTTYFRHIFKGFLEENVEIQEKIQIVFAPSLAAQNWWTKFQNDPPRVVSLPRSGFPRFWNVGLTRGTLPLAD